MNSDALSGQTVLVTRPSNQQQSMQQLIESQGGSVLSLPLIEIHALTIPSDVQKLKDKVLQLDNYQVLIFVSNNAVSFGGELINDYWPQFPSGIDVIAVGPTTACALRKLLDCEVLQPESGMTSEDILQLPQLQEISEKKIGIVRGKGGRELLAHTLKQRGAHVDYLEAYMRKAIDYDSGEFTAKLKAANVNVLTVSSGESLHRLAALVADSSGIMEKLKLLVPSERVAQQAKDAGFREVRNVRGADPASFVAALGELNINQE